MMKKKSCIVILLSFIFVLFSASLEVSNNTITNTLKPRVAIVLDDAGENTNQIPVMKELLDNGIKNITLAVFPFPYACCGKEITKSVKKMGFSVIAHIPMEPINAYNRGIITEPYQKEMYLLASDTSIEEELEKKFDLFMKTFVDDEGTYLIEGCNNHQGSLFTCNEDAMTKLAEILRKREMFFLDSKNYMSSCNLDVMQMMKAHNVLAVKRTHWLDQGQYTPRDKIVKNFVNAMPKENTSDKVVMIGHIINEHTVGVLFEYIPKYKDRVDFVKIEDVLEYH